MGSRGTFAVAVSPAGISAIKSRAAACSETIASETLGAWVPDALTILLLSLTAELDDRDVPKACVVLAFARLAFGVRVPVVSAVATFAAVTGGDEQQQGDQPGPVKALGDRHDVDVGL